MYVYVYECMYMCMYVCICVCMYVHCICMYVYVRMYVCMYVVSETSGIPARLKMGEALLYNDVVGSS